MLNRNVCSLILSLVVFTMGALPVQGADHGGASSGYGRTAAETGTGAAGDPCGPGRPGTGSSKPGADAFAARCASCHGANRPIKNKSDALRRITLDPLDPDYMPKNKTVLTNDEIEKLQAYFSN